jgi:hypothetical protein
MWRMRVVEEKAGTGTVGLCEGWNDGARIETIFPVQRIWKIGIAVWVVDATIYGSQRDSGETRGL